MADKNRLKVVLCWHMHQPNYLDPSTGKYHLPWTYLHAMKDYVDMAAHLEALPEARAVVNFAPILLEQLDNYSRQVVAFLESGKALDDPLLEGLVMTALPADIELRMRLVRACLRVNESTVIQRFPAFKRLADIAARLNDDPEEWRYVNGQYVADILVWYHLGWLSETLRRSDLRVKKLMEKGAGYSIHDRLELFKIIGEQLCGVIARYRCLAEQGQIELSVTPYAHPIVPLLLDIESAREAQPDVTLPAVASYPGGEERSRWHIEKGIETFEHFFGFKPQGCWPSEGAVSTATLALLDEYGFRWAATGESVLNNTLGCEEIDAEVRNAHCLHRPYRVAGGKGSCFFRDDGLSDLIGFRYADWHADDAVGNLISHLENIADSCEEHEDAVVSIILDGENAWEYYPENGYHFLHALYKQLSTHSRLDLTTFSAALDEITPHAELSRVVAGSWVYGTFSTWIGDADKNRGWEMLIAAKQVFDRVVTSGQLGADRIAVIERQLAVCEGSDWFWWFGDYNPSAAVHDFERLFRLQLATLYQMLEEEPPESLAHSFTHGGGDPAAGGVMRQGQES